MKHQRQNSERVYIDPVCGMDVSYKMAPAILEYRNNVYCFCAVSCNDAFEKDPDRYLQKRPKNQKPN